MERAIRPPASAHATITSGTIAAVGGGSVRRLASLPSIELTAGEENSHPLERARLSNQGGDLVKGRRHPPGGQADRIELIDDQQ